MTEQEAKKELEIFVDFYALNSKEHEALDIAIKALETMAQMEKRNLTPDIIMEYAKFEDECVNKGYTFKSLLEAREKMTPKKPIDKIMYKQCPSCGEVDILNDKYCHICGQAIK